MKRDWELCRKILKLTESYEKIPRPGIPTIEGYGEEQIGYHCYLLDDAGLLAAGNLGLLNMSWGYYPRNLTSAGHDFLEAAEAPGVWQRTFETIREKALPTTVEVVKAMLFEVVKSSMSGSGP